ncbi:hypothetical protein ACFFV7_39915 [Nonomuraea spiralis]|uniref:Uncharacterized protein n=1 Tax=Nonomuraea spiralis TaxID=46182 RepID=A0ABV5IS84_9ACTN|nr:hypothetical protein [Nonomuraea spiralis]GGT46368.1 hypothetical protein GCM10010176_106770 [Nonomuraea spiralis]
MEVTRRRPGGFTVALALVGLALLFVSVPEIGPVVRAARADGVSGVFTARELRCVRHPGHESCVWAGDFTSGDGRVRRRDVELYGSDRGTLTAGQATAAVDTGRETRVYGPDGSDEWLFTGLLMLAGAAVLTVAAGRVRRPAAGSGTRAVEASGDPYDSSSISGSL